MPPAVNLLGADTRADAAAAAPLGSLGPARAPMPWPVCGGPARHGHGHGLTPDTLRHRGLVLARISSEPYRPALGYGRLGP
jgi:hypothetical protein